MRSSGYFAFRVASFALVVILALIVSVLIFNFIFFSIRLSGESELLGFGPRGFLFFLQMFPWPLLVVDVILVVVAEHMLRYFRFGYRNPVLVLLAGLLIMSVALGLLIDRTTPFNDRMLERAHHHHLGPIDEMYEGAHRPGPLGGGICHCMITAVGTSSLIAYDEDASTTLITIELPPNFMTSLFDLKAGETVYVAGDRVGDTIRAFGVHARMPPPPVPLP